ncbi:MmgE/PrpD family protein [Rhodococcus marinonascens]|uniref:MmgE/PrpD family protein n=1 Tax=Rhodococcus marinonascens TaxID=38311 RepID=UPI0009341E40|nr:MmgE/PrpD family protein [Rhodococcus marinonascens]
MTDLTLAQQLARFASKTHFEDLPEAVVGSVGMRVLDTLGIAIAATDLETSRAATAWACEQGGAATASAIGLDVALPAPLAAFVNGVLAHSLDFDDTHLPSILHPSASVVPAALAAAQQHQVDGRTLVRGIAIGLEVCVRLGMAGFDPVAKNSVFFEHGQHATSICGAMGSAVAAAVIGGGAEERIVDTLGIAASMAAGIIEANRTGGTVKRMHCGWAAHSALAAAGLARHGITGPPTVLEGRFGFFQAWLHEAAREAEIIDGLGTDWAVPSIFFKPYPANHFTHAAIDAGAALRRRGVSPDDVERLVLGVPAANLRTIGEPIEVKRTPATGYMAQFSGPYAVVVGMFGGGGLGAALEDYSDELATSAERRALMAKVDVVPDSRCDEIFPHQFPAVLTAMLTDGTTLVEEVLTTRGGPERPLSFEEVSAKFTANAGPFLPDRDIADLAARCHALSGLEDIGVLLEPLTSIGLRSDR